MAQTNVTFNYVNSISLTLTKYVESVNSHNNYCIHKALKMTEI